MELKTLRSICFLLSVAFLMAFGVAPAISKEIRECTREQERLFETANSNMSSKDERTCQKAGGSVREVNGVKFCANEPKQTFCENRFGGDFSYAYKQNCCVYSPVINW